MVSTNMETVPLTKGEKTRRHVLETAARLINVKGYHNTSMNDIIDATGVKKGNLYFHFSCKEDLVFELVEHAKKEYGIYLCKNISGENSREKLTSLMEAVGRFHSQNGFIGGCVFGNMALEVGDENPRIAELVRSVFMDWAAMIEALVRRGIESGEIPGKTDPAAAAWHMIATLEGAVMMAKLTKRESDFTAICGSFIDLLFAC